MKVSSALAMLLIATLMQNIATTTAYAGYGIVMPSLIEEFKISRSTAALGTSLLALISALMSPLAGRLVDRWSLRKTAIIGTILGALGLGIASIAPHFAVLLLGFSVIGGLANACCGSLPSSTLASRWFPERTGTAVAICMLPIAVTLGSPLFGWLQGEIGWRGLVGVFAGLYLLLALPALLIRDHPAAVLQQATGAVVDATPFSAIALMRQWTFWFLLIGAGTLFGTSVTLISYVVSAAVELGIPQTRASTLISIVGITGAAGGLTFGWLSDRIGPALTLAIIAGGSAGGWVLLGVSTSFTTVAIGAGCASFCGGGAVVSPLSAFIGQIYGRSVFGRVLGLIRQLTLPLLFALPVAVGALYDFSGSYRVSFLAMAALCGVAAVLLASLRGHRATAVAA